MEDQVLEEPLVPTEILIMTVNARQRMLYDLQFSMFISKTTGNY